MDVRLRLMTNLSWYHTQEQTCPYFKDIIVQATIWHIADIFSVLEEFEITTTKIRYTSRKESKGVLRMHYDQWHNDNLFYQRTWTCKFTLSNSQQYQLMINEFENSIKTVVINNRKK